jgi:hypothetical protein
VPLGWVGSAAARLMLGGRLRVWLLESGFVTSH